MKNKVLIFRPPCARILPVPATYFRTDIFPLSIAHIVSALEKNDIPVSVADPADLEQYSPKEIARRLIKEKPSVVGISCHAQNRFACKHIAEIVKSINKRITVVFGGIFSTFLYRYILSFWPVDIIVRHEGEEVFLELYQALAGERRLTAIKGIAFREDGKIIENPGLRFIKYLDSLPLPAYHHFRLCKENPFDVFKEPVPFMRMDSSRGCPSGCLFCSGVGMWQRKVRYFSIRRILKEIKFVKDRFKIDSFAFSDINFATSTARIRQFCRGLIAQKLNIQWLCATRADARLSEGDFSLMKKSGCRMIEFGIESLSDGILRSINKGIDSRTQLLTLRRADRAGILIGVNLILGFPEENEETLRQTLEVVRKKVPPVQNYWLERLKLSPGSPLYENEVRSGRFKEESWFLSERVWKVYERDKNFSMVCDHYSRLIESAFNANIRHQAR